jgi:DNA topoisomerase-1
MYLKVGPYGPYLQLGGEEQEGKPKRVSLPKGVKPEEVTPELAAGLLLLPRELGRHPETGERVYAGIGRFGPYVRHGKTFASLTKDDDVLKVTLERAVELLAKKTQRGGPLRVLGQHPETGDDIEVRDGKYGPYVKHGRTNASLRDDQRVDTLSLEEGLELLAAREKSKPARSTKPKRSGKGNRTSAKGKTSKAGKAKKAPRKSTPKATPAQLAAHLHELDAQDADIVKRLEGLNGQQPQAPSQVARSLDLSEDEVKKAHKRGMFKLRMAYGKARKEQAA